MPPPKDASITKNSPPAPAAAIAAAKEAGGTGGNTDTSGKGPIPYDHKGSDQTCQTGAGGVPFGPQMDEAAFAVNQMNAYIQRQKDLEDQKAAKAYKEATKGAKQLRQQKPTMDNGSKGKGQGKGNGAPVRDFVTVKEAKEGNLIIREMVELERSIMGVFKDFESHLDTNLAKDDIFILCRAHYLKHKHNKPVAQTKSPNDGPKPKSVNAPPPKLQKDPKSSTKEPPVAPAPEGNDTSLSKDDEKIFHIICPTRIGALLEQEGRGTTSDRRVHSEATKKIHSKVVSDLLERNKTNKNTKLYLRTAQILKVAKADSDVLKKTSRIDFAAQGASPVGIWPPDLNDTNKYTQVAAEDPIAEFLYKRVAQYGDSVRGSEVRNAYSLLWHSLQSDKVKGSSNPKIEDCKLVKDMSLTDLDVKRAAAKLFMEAVPFWKLLAEKLSPSHPVAKEHLDGCTADGKTVSEKEIPETLRPVNFDLSRRLGRGNATICSLLADETNEFSVLKNFQKSYRLPKEA